MGKGGVGKTTVSASIGSVFAELRQDDRVVAIDADTAFGKLGSRVDPKAQGSYWELASDQHLETFADLRGRVGNNAAGLFVLAGEATPARRRVLDPAIYREATSRLDRYFTISIIDCSSTMDTPVTQEVLRDLDALIVVSSPWVDGAAAAGQTMDWLAARGLTNLLQRTVIVLNDSDGHADKRTRSILAQQFSSSGPDGDRGAVRRAPAARRRHRPHQRDVAGHEAPLHRDRRCARRVLPDARRPEQGTLLSRSASEQRFDLVDRGGGHRLLGFRAHDVSSETPAAWAVSSDGQVGADAGGIQPLTKCCAGCGCGAHHEFVDTGGGRCSSALINAGVTWLMRVAGPRPPRAGAGRPGSPSRAA